MELHQLQLITNDVLRAMTACIIIVGSTILFLYDWQQSNHRTNHHHKGTASSSCPNPDCIRCQRYRLVQQRAKQRWKWVTTSTFTSSTNDDVPQQQPQDLDRIQQAVHAKHGVLKSSIPNQAPTVVFLPGLRCQPIVTEWHSDVCRRLQAPGILESIRAELDCRADDDKLLWGQNDTSQGSWQVLSFLNQGQWDAHLMDLYPTIGNLIQTLPGCLDKCLFGNAFISKIQPNTKISPHCGPTNLRHRLQLPLWVSSVERHSSDKQVKALAAADKNTVNKNDNHKNEIKTGLLVADQLISWTEGVPFVFDDSLVHSVDYTHNTASSSSERVVLIVDLWHPDLSARERDVLCQLYPPFVGVTTST